MNGDNRSRTIEVFVESMEHASLLYHSKVLKYQHEVFQLTSDTLGRVVTWNRFLPDKDREALDLVSRVAREKEATIVVFDLAQNLKARAKALKRGIVRTPAVLVDGKRLKKITHDELISFLGTETS